MIGAAGEAWKLQLGLTANRYLGTGHFPVVSHRAATQSVWSELDPKLCISVAGFSLDIKQAPNGKLVGTNWGTIEGTVDVESVIVLDELQHHVKVDLWYRDATKLPGAKLHVTGTAAEHWIDESNPPPVDGMTTGPKVAIPDFTWEDQFCQLERSSAVAAKMSRYLSFSLKKLRASPRTVS